MRIFDLFGAIAALFLALSASGAAAQSADRLSAGIAANKTSLSATAADYGALSAIGAAEQEATGCYRAAEGRAANVGDLPPDALRALRECIAGAYANLLAKMERLKSLQRNAVFDYALFAETSRLLADAETPGRAAIAPFQAMLDAASAAAQHESERLVLAEMTALNNQALADGV
ncbi:MAG: hypothetical protein AAFW46_08190 [Pseudomonadota bacterium]